MLPEMLIKIASLLLLGYSFGFETRQLKRHVKAFSGISKIVKKFNHLESVTDEYRLRLL